MFKRAFAASFSTLALLALACAPLVRAETINVAVAASLQYVFDDLATAFNKESGDKAVASLGASGKLATQIRNGAPFGVFLSADVETPQALFDAGLTTDAPVIYGYGSLVLWTTADLDLKNWQALLENPAVQHIAVANPKTAPYGREAMRLLTGLKLDGKLGPKLVYGESIQQVNQYVVSHAAEVGFTAKSVVVSPEVHGVGRWVELPRNLYQPIAQGAVLMKNASPAAARFYAFLYKPAARAIWQQYGYQLPAEH